MRSTPITPASGKLEMKRSRRMRKRIKTEKEKGKGTRALEFVCHKKQRCLPIKANEEKNGQADPERSLAFPSEPEGSPVLHSFMPLATEGILLSKAHFPRVPWICNPPPSAQGVSSFSLLLCLQQHHSYKSNITNLEHSTLDPAVSTTNLCRKLPFAVEFIYLFCCCSSDRSSLLSLLWPETHYAAQV